MNPNGTTGIGILGILLQAFNTPETGKAYIRVMARGLAGYPGRARIMAAAPKGDKEAEAAVTAILGNLDALAADKIDHETARVRIERARATLIAHQPRRKPTKAKTTRKPRDPSHLEQQAQDYLNAALEAGERVTARQLMAKLHLSSLSQVSGETGLHAWKNYRRKVTRRPRIVRAGKASGYTDHFETVPHQRSHRIQGDRAAKDHEE